MTKFFFREENKEFLIRVWKPLPNNRVLKTLKESSKGKAQRERYLLAVCLECYMRTKGLEVKIEMESERTYLNIFKYMLYKLLLRPDKRW